MAHLFSINIETDINKEYISNREKPMSEIIFDDNLTRQQTLRTMLFPKNDVEPRLIRFFYRTIMRDHSHTSINPFLLVADKQKKIFDDMKYTLLDDEGKKFKQFIDDTYEFITTEINIISKKDIKSEKDVVHLIILVYIILDIGTIIGDKFKNIKK